MISLILASFSFSICCTSAETNGIQEYTSKQEEKRMRHMKCKKVLRPKEWMAAEVGGSHLLTTAPARSVKAYVGYGEIADGIAG